MKEQCSGKHELLLQIILDNWLTGSSLSDIDKHCLNEFRKHWECLDNNNQQLWQCRRFERPLNKCVFDNLVCKFCSAVDSLC